MVKSFLVALAAVVFLSGCQDKKNNSGTRTRLRDASRKTTPQNTTQTTPAPAAGSGPEIVITDDPKKNPPAGSASNDKASPAPASGQATTPPAATPQSSSPTVQIPPGKTLPEGTVISAPAPQAPQVTPAPTSTGTAAAGSEKQQDSQASDFVQLTATETQSLLQVMSASTSAQNLGRLLTPQVSSRFDAEKLDIRFSGTYDKFQLAVLLGQDVVVQFQDVQFSVQGQTRKKQNEFDLLGHCVGANCEVLFVTVLRFENRQLQDNLPLLLKLQNNRYVKAQLNDEALAQALEQGGIKIAPGTQVPPQLKVQAKLEENKAKHLGSILSAIRKRMQSTQAIYSARFFVNLKAGTFDWKLKQVAQGLQVELLVEFVEIEKRSPLQFKGTVPEAGAQLKDSSGITLDVYPLIQNEFFLMVFENPKFESELPNVQKALSVNLCQVLVEKNETFAACEFLPSTTTLGTPAQEGFIGGPALINAGKIIPKYTPLTAEEILKSE